MSDEPGAYAYMLRCADGSYYVGSARRGLDQRIGEHNAGTYGGYTSTRRRVVLVWAQNFLIITDAIAVERQIKGWSRAKKEALVPGNYDTIKTPIEASNSNSHRTLKTRAECALPPFETSLCCAPEVL